MTKQELIDEINNILTAGECGTITPSALNNLLQDVVDFIEQEVDDIPSGPAGATPEIGENGNWWINGEDTGLRATGTDGDDGVTPQISENNTWEIDGTDTGVKAIAIDGDTPIISETTKTWWIGGQDTGVNAVGSPGPAPVILANGNWGINGEDTGKPSTGASPEIGENENWWVNGSDTGVKAQGKDGATPTIGENGNWWIDGTDTGVPTAGSTKTAYNSDIIGVRGEAGSVFSLPEAFYAGTLKLYLDGGRLTPGGGKDYTVINDTQFRLERETTSDDSDLIADYVPKK